MRCNPRSCRSHFKTPRFVTEKLTAFEPNLHLLYAAFGDVFAPYELRYSFDMQEEFFCRNALTRLGAYDEDVDDEMYLLAIAEDGNAIAQLEMADMCSPSHSASSHLPRILLLTVAQLQLAGHDIRSCSLVQGCRRTRISQRTLHFRLSGVWNAEAFG